MNIALQLYTVRDLTASDFAGTLRHVAAIGYRSVELAGYGNLHSAKEARRALDDAGLSVAGMHVPIDACEANLGSVLDDCRTLASRVLIVPWIPEGRRQTADGWRSVGQSLAQMAQIANARGIELAYHHHSFEFERFEGRTAMEILFESAGPELKAELDVYWLKHGGADPVEFIERFGKRTIALHLKDMSAGEDRRFAPVASGILDFPAILKAAGEAGVSYGAVEQDDCYGKPPLEEVRISFENLRRLGAV